MQRAEAHSPCVKHSHVGDRGFEQPHLLLTQRRLAQRVSTVGVHSHPSGRIHTSVHEGLVVAGGRGVGTLVRFTGAGVIAVVNTRVVRVVVVVVGAIRGEINAENVTPNKDESYTDEKNTRAVNQFGKQMPATHASHSYGILTRCGRIRLPLPAAAFLQSHSLPRRI